MNLIVDASVIVKWLVPEDGSDRASVLMLRTLMAPDTVIPECLNALRRKVLRGEIEPGYARVAARLLSRSGIVLESTQPLAEDILELALRLQLAPYDCTYLALARARGGVLITADERLLARCRKPDAADLSQTVQALDEPPAVQERPARAYMPRRKAA